MVTAIAVEHDACHEGRTHQVVERLAHVGGLANATQRSEAAVLASIAA